MTPVQKKLAYELITNPPPGSKLAEAKAYGIDLTLLYENLALTPDQRARNLEKGAASLRALRETGAKHRVK